MSVPQAKGIERLKCGGLCGPRDAIPPPCILGTSRSQSRPFDSLVQTQLTHLCDELSMPLPADILRPHLSAVTYTPVKPLDVLALEIGIPEAQLIKLDANENLYGPLPSVRAAMDGADMHIYPDPSQHKLKLSLSQLHDCSPHSLVVGAGSDEVCVCVFELHLCCDLKMCLGLRAGYQDCAMQRGYLLQSNIRHVRGASFPQ